MTYAQDKAWMMEVSDKVRAEEPMLATAIDNFLEDFHIWDRALAAADPPVAVVVVLLEPTSPMQAKSFFGRWVNRFEGFLSDAWKKTSIAIDDAKSELEWAMRQVDTITDTAIDKVERTSGLPGVTVRSITEPIKEAQVEVIASMVELVDTMGRAAKRSTGFLAVGVVGAGIYFLGPAIQVWIRAVARGQR